MSLCVQNNVTTQNQTAFNARVKKMYISKGYRQLAAKKDLNLPKHMTLEEFKKTGSIYPHLSKSLEVNVLKMTDWEIYKTIYIDDGIKEFFYKLTGM